MWVSVQAVPYWVDDESVRPSMLMSAPAPMVRASYASLDTELFSNSLPAACKAPTELQRHQMLSLIKCLHLQGTGCTNSAPY